MAGVTSVEIKESLDEVCQLLRQSKEPKDKERLQILYWLKQDNPPTIGAIAQGIGKHRNTVQTWLLKYREGGIEAMLEVKKAPGRVRIIPKWAEASLAKRLGDPNHGFASYGAVQQWLAQTLGVEAEYHAVYQMTRYRLNAKLKVARPQNSKQNVEQGETFKKTLQTTCP
ncbi:MAG: helix-turn-helix domain-containing protein [Acaryochloridaceae cyanobacterium RU_4_10]|nr:helix-turn-helix domain-containing protein [Acaryochloridaceae cyanobacterium RU_4_10]